MQDFTVNLSECRVFPKPELPTAHHQIPVAREDAVNTAIVALLRIFKVAHIPLRLFNAAQKLHPLPDVILHRLPFVFAYIDVAAVARALPVEHFKCLRRVFETLNSNFCHSSHAAVYPGSGLTRTPYSGNLPTAFPVSEAFLVRGGFWLLPTMESTAKFGKGQMYPSESPLRVQRGCTRSSVLERGSLTPAKDHCLVSQAYALKSRDPEPYAASLFFWSTLTTTLHSFSIAASF